MFPEWLIELGKAIGLLAMMAFGMGAKVLDPLRSSEARGKVGGLIYNTTRGTKYVKSKTAPAQPRTARQLYIRAVTQNFTRQWASLTQAQRDSWNDYAALNTEIDWTGQPQRKTGHNWYVRCQARLMDAGQANTTDAPSVSAPDGLFNFAAADGVAQSICTWSATAGTDYQVEIYRQGPISAGVVPKREKAAFAGRVTGESGTITITGLTPGTHAFWARVLDETTGLISTYVLDSAVVT